MVVGAVFNRELLDLTHTDNRGYKPLPLIIVSSDCFQRKMIDTIINFLKCLPDYAAFLSSATVTAVSRYDFNDRGLPVFM